MLWTVVVVYVLYKVVTWTLPRLRVGHYGQILPRLRVGHYGQKHVLVTGCDTGFGNVLAKRLDRLGFHVFAGCLTSEGAKRLRGECSDHVMTLALDVTNEKSITAARRLVESSLPAGRGLWGVVNNAGISGIPVPAEWASSEDWMKCLSVNLFGVIEVTRAFLPLVRQCQGRVVNMSSIAGRFVSFAAPYCVSKFGVEAFSDCLRREVYNQGVKVCVLEPGLFRTGIVNVRPLVDNYRTSYENTPQEIRQVYPNTYKAIETFIKYLNIGNDDLDLVVDAYELALTSRFPPTRQVVGKDAIFLNCVLMNLPTPLSDWLMVKLMKF